jgi:hypothetical protein
MRLYDLAAARMQQSMIMPGAVGSAGMQRVVGYGAEHLRSGASRSPLKLGQYVVPGSGVLGGKHTTGFAVCRCLVGRRSAACCAGLRCGATIPVRDRPTAGIQRRPEICQRGDNRAVRVRQLPSKTGAIPASSNAAIVQLKARNRVGWVNQRRNPVPRTTHVVAEAVPITA